MRLQIYVVFLNLQAPFERFMLFFNIKRYTRAEYVFASTLNMSLPHTEYVVPHDWLARPESIPCPQASIPCPQTSIPGTTEEADL